MQLQILYQETQSYHLLIQTILLIFQLETKEVFCTIPHTKTISPGMDATKYVVTLNSTLSEDQTLDSGVLAGPVTITGTQTSNRNIGNYLMSKIEVNTVEPQCGTTLTLGASGDTVTLGSGASQSGFGSTGGISWQTSIKTGDFTAVSNEGYFLNTTSGTITVTLPASPTAGNVVAIKDYARTFGTNSVTLNRNGSNMDGAAANTTLETSGLSVILVFMDSTKGWSFINEDTTTQIGATFISASGGTETESGDFKIHTFTGPGTFTVNSVGNAVGSNTVSYLVLAGAGGGAGANGGGGGGGAGGYRESKASTDCYSASPLNATSGPTYNLPVSVQGYPIVVGAGGAGHPEVLLVLMEHLETLHLFQR